MSETQSDLTPLLNAVITTVFDNEDKFLKECWRYGAEPSYKGCELLEFYMSSESCRLAVLLPCGTTITDTVKTVDVIDWKDSI